MQQNHLTQIYVGACVLLRVYVPTMAPVTLATGATNGKLPPNTLARRELPQNHITVKWIRSLSPYNRSLWESVTLQKPPSLQCTVTLLQKGNKASFSKVQAAVLLHDSTLSGLTLPAPQNQSSCVLAFATVQAWLGCECYRARHRIPGHTCMHTYTYIHTYIHTCW